MCCRLNTFKCQRGGFDAYGDDTDFTGYTGVKTAFSTALEHVLNSKCLSAVPLITISQGRYGIIYS